MPGLHKKALYLEYFTVGYNVLEGVASILAGYLASYIALVGLGWIAESSRSRARCSSGGYPFTGLTREEEERVEKKAVRFVGLSFFILVRMSFLNP